MVYEINFGYLHQQQRRNKFRKPRQVGRTEKPKFPGSSPEILHKLVLGDRQQWKNQHASQLCGVEDAAELPV